MPARKFIKDSAGYAFSQYIVRATLMLRGLLAARLLGPGGYGTWNAIQIMMDWGPVAPAGTQGGLDQLVPPAIVAGDANALRRLKRAALFNISLFSGIFAVVSTLWVVTGGSNQMREDWGFFGVVAAMVCVVSTNLCYYQASIMRSHGDITTSSGMLALQGGIGGVLGLALVPWLHRWGLLLGWLVGCLAAVTYSTVRSRRFAPMSPAPGPDSARLVLVGFPMYVYSVGWQLVSRSADRMIILRFLGTDALGYYSLSVMALTFLLYLPDSVSFVIYPQLLRRFRESERDPASIRARVERVLQASSLIVPPLAASAALLANAVVGVLLPKFRPGVPSLQVLCFGAPLLAFTNLAAIVLMTLGRYRSLVAATIVGMVAFVSLDLGVAFAHRGLIGIAWATLAAYAINGSLMLFLALRGMGSSPRRALGLVARYIAPLAVALPATLAILRWLPVPPGRDVGSMLLRPVLWLGAFAIPYFLVAWPLSHNLGLLATLAEVDVPIVGGLLRRLHRLRSGDDA